jgi:hypothetical protein
MSYTFGFGGSTYEVTVTGGLASFPTWLIRGAGTPEGVVTADIGSIYSRSDGGAGTSVYFKESGDGLSTGWRDTGKVLATVTTVSAALHELSSLDDILHVTRTATGASAITLMSAQVLSGRQVEIKDAAGNAGTYNITISTESAETIDGDATNILDTDYQSVSLYSDGSNWFIY